MINSSSLIKILVKKLKQFNCIYSTIRITLWKRMEVGYIPSIFFRSEENIGLLVETCTEKVILCVNTNNTLIMCHFRAPKCRTRKKCSNGAMNKNKISYKTWQLKEFTHKYLCKKHMYIVKRK